MNMNIENIKKSLMGRINIVVTYFTFCKNTISYFYNDSIFVKNIYVIVNKYYPYCKLCITSIIHAILFLFIVLCMLTNKITRILFFRWTKFMDFIGRKRVILDRESDEHYIERYYLFLIDRNDNFPFNIFLHHILKSDNDDLHDHPWGYFTLILNGGYYEHLELENAETNEKQIVKIWRGPGFYQSVSSSHIHRLELDKTKGETWTLFIPFKQEKNWGFYTKDGYIDNETYLENKFNNKNK